MGWAVFVIPGIYVLVLLAGGLLLGTKGTKGTNHKRLAIGTVG
jgi:hypothetical protein